MDFIQSLIGGGLGTAVVGGLLVLANTVLSKKTTSPADRVASETAANDLIFKLLDRADKQIDQDAKVIAQLESRLQERPEDSDARELLGEVIESRDRTVLERDRLRTAIERLRSVARAKGSLTQEEVVAWANNALDVDEPLFDFDTIPSLPSEVEDTQAHTRRPRR